MNDSANSCNDDGKARIDAYLDLVEARVFRALASDAVQQSCSTTLLLVFAAIDALGKLTHPNPKAPPGERFRHFLESLGARYEERSDELWNLRNALVHNLINIESYLSSVELEGWTHLESVGPEELLYVNTRTASCDLRQAFGALKIRLATSAGAAELAASRLEWLEGEVQTVGGGIAPTPPPPVQFVWAR
jgi:hypothetical protein